MLYEKLCNMPIFSLNKRYPVWYRCFPVQNRRAQGMASFGCIRSL